MTTTQMTGHPAGGWDIEADVVVLGFGAAGCAAAIEAHDAGASVIVLEKMEEGLEGGNTRVSGGIWFDNRDPERAAVYLRSLCGDNPLPEPVVTVWAEETYRNTAWLEGLGAKIGSHGAYPPEYPELEGSDAFGGYLGVEGRMGDGLLYDVLTRAVRARGIEVRLATPARELMQDTATGAVHGVLATGPDSSPLRIRARRGVVLATGGFEADQQMVRDYLRLPDSVVWGTPAATGDGHRMAMKAGADLWHMDNMMTVTGMRAPGFRSGFYTPFFLGKNFLYIGKDGTRLADEQPQVGHGQAVLHGNYELFPVRPMHVIFDENARLAGPVSPGRDMLPVGWNLLVEGYEWSADNSAEIEKGWIHRADTLEDLAGILGLDPHALLATVQRWNAACAAGVDDQFGRDPQTLAPLDRAPYYAFSWGPMVAWSNGGPRRDERARVLDPFGAVIPGLLAAGNVSSTYSWAKDGGMHIADALAFGRVAGRTAAAGE
ncbi:FAD-binding dehydrogenase [Streptomyces viridiviolaceus]|uniref:FAD-dependent oxidoreductase n=1 Tax=Streptomyces viridiviolaceus TaxID=68282 RepID=A0ABW2DWT1_9ACTN|nr:FAD-dependent oxidoreductase [Streptomyces viridiviolaceus]GHB15721.1 FAD-binding dehydrogenase [Streptomyces viridiviolaceus]